MSNAIPNDLPDQPAEELNRLSGPEAAPINKICGHAGQLQCKESREAWDPCPLHDDPWRPGGLRVYTDEQRLEGEDVKTWVAGGRWDDRPVKPKKVPRDVEEQMKSRKVELEGLFQWLEDYLDPNLITSGFFKFDMYAVAEVWNLEKEVRTAALEAQDPKFEISVEDKNLSGPGHSRWAFINEAYIKGMSGTEKQYALDLAKEDILFLRTRLVKLQRLIHKRMEILKKGGSLTKFSYLGQPRPAEREALFIDGFEEHANKAFGEKLKELAKERM